MVCCSEVGQSGSERVDFDNIDTNNDDSVRPDGEPFGPTFVTINGLKMWGFEGNKVWRLAPTPRGTIVEPFIGLRYARIRDIADRTDIFNNFNDLNFDLVNVAPNAVDTINRINFNYREASITTDNDLFGGQLGMRSRWKRGRWQVSSDIRGLGFWNHQVKETLARNEEQSENFVATFDANGVLTGVAEAGNSLVQETSQEHTFDSHDTFVYGGELNVDLAFELTQGFAVNVGGEIIYLADGIGRGPINQSESLLLTGLTFGFTLNR